LELQEANMVSILCLFMALLIGAQATCDMECWLKLILVNIPNQTLPIDKLVCVCAFPSLDLTHDQGATGYVNVTNMVCSQVELGSINSGNLRSFAPPVLLCDRFNHIVSFDSLERNGSNQSQHIGHWNELLWVLVVFHSIRYVLLFFLFVFILSLFNFGTFVLISLSHYSLAMPHFFRLNFYWKWHGECERCE
jgi:hypothetical protein